MKDVRARFMETRADFRTSGVSDEKIEDIEGKSKGMRCSTSERQKNFE